MNTTSQWKIDFSKHSISLDELISGGVGRDGIPPIDNPTQFLFKEQADNRIFPTSRVLAAEIDGQANAYPFKILAEKRIINDQVGRKHVLAVWQPGVASALDKSDINAPRDVGMAALYNRSLDNQTLSFRIEDSLVRDEQTNSGWNIFGQAVEGKLVNRQLQQELAYPHFWFAWVAFKPETLIHDDTTSLVYSQS